MLATWWTTTPILRPSWGTGVFHSASLRPSANAIRAAAPFSSTDARSSARRLTAPGIASIAATAPGLGFIVVSPGDRPAHHAPSCASCRTSAPTALPSVRETLPSVRLIDKRAGSEARPGKSAALRTMASYSWVTTRAWIDAPRRNRNSTFNRRKEDRDEGSNRCAGRRGDRDAGPDSPIARTQEVVKVVPNKEYDPSWMDIASMLKKLPVVKDSSLQVVPLGNGKNITVGLAQLGPHTADPGPCPQDAR